MLKQALKNDKNTIEQDTIELKKQIKLWQEKANLIRSQFNFNLPNYIIDEIINNESSKNYRNLHILINVAILNNKLSKKDGNILRSIY